MSYIAEKVIDIALAEVGYLEKRSNSQLDSKTANAGGGNFTKYARDLHTAGYYNGNKQGVAWCNVFVDWCHYIASGKDKAAAQKVSCQSGPYGAGCRYSLEYYKFAGQYVTENPQPGDQIYFGSKGSVDHTGIVWKVDGGRVYTVEGNTSGDEGVVWNGGGVFQKSYPLDHSRILGYGRPLYDSDDTENTKPEKPTEDKPAPGTFNVNLSVLKNGSKGQQVKALQQLLIGNGCTCGSWGADGNFGSATEQAVKNYQKKKSLQVDGMAGPQTWTSLLTG